MVEKFPIVFLILNKNPIYRNMMHMFRKDKFDSNLYDLELKIENQQKQIDDLRVMILELSKQINKLEIEINYLSNNRYGKGI